MLSKGASNQTTEKFLYGKFIGLEKNFHSKTSLWGYEIRAKIFPIDLFPIYLVFFGIKCLRRNLVICDYFIDAYTGAYRDYFYKTPIFSYNYKSSDYLNH